ncbi:phosphatase PAP2 family protein [Pedobacter duraquae]|uniref:PAP2 superfamily protein n=1 Tax=Pedobacter duraquae TaxID=425511 RepID=A0A4R6IK21_9SPHI|nr:phosphatase PAP2 family protein [Pedobacter duraquae]TDO22404.1 PAP2 superfamily protein [Pedobacter duraquae]
MHENANGYTSFYALKNFLVTTLLSILYLLVSAILVGFKSDQIVLLLIFNVAFYASRFSRKFILGFSIFIVYWIIFDYMKALPNYRYHSVSIEQLYNLEKHFFGIHTPSGMLTPNEFLKLHTSKAADLITGIFYLLWIPVPLAFAGYLFFKNKLQFLYFSFTFVLVNLIGFVIYYLYPAAPPWYVQLHGFHFVANTPGNTGGLSRFDQLIDAPVFKSIYSKSSNVFAAMPSLHSSYPVIVLYYGIKNRLGLVNLFFGLVMLGIWFTALYTSHHYLLDVLAGISCAISGIFSFNWLASKQPFQNWLNKFQSVIN